MLLMLGVGKVQTLESALHLWPFSKQFWCWSGKQKANLWGCASPEPVTHRLLNKFCPDSVPVKINLKWDPIAPTYSTLPRAALGI